MDHNGPGFMRDTRSILAGLTLAAAVLVIYALRLDDAAGLIVDDAWYIVLAKSVAQGDGYRLISAATTPILPAVPPGFPLLLAPGFLLEPSFPDNLPLLKAVSVAAMLAVGVLAYRYFVEIRALPSLMAAVLSAATVLVPAFVFLATSTVMAECVFALTQLAGVWLLDRTGRSATKPHEARNAVAAGLVAGGCLLVRLAGIALVVAGVAILVRGRRWRALVLFVAIAGGSQLPWITYSRLHAPSAEEQRAHGGSMAYSYADLLAFRVGGSAGAGRASAVDVAARVAANLAGIGAKDVGGILVPVLYRGPGESGQELVSLGASQPLFAGSMGNAPVTLYISSVLSLILFLGFVANVRSGITTAEILVPISIAMITLVPAWSFRYTLTLAPFLLLYLFAGVDQIARWLSRRIPAVAAYGPARVAGIAVLLVVGLQLMDHVQYIALARNRTAIDWLGDADEIAMVHTFMNEHLPPQGRVASTNPGLTFLMTGRKTMASDEPDKNWDRWRNLGVRYMVALRPIELPSRSLGYEVRFASPRRRLWVIELTEPRAPTGY